MVSLRPGSTLPSPHRPLTLCTPLSSLRKRCGTARLNCEQVDAVRDWNRVAVFVFVFNMSGTMRVFRIHIHGIVIEKKLHELDREDIGPGILVHDVEFILDGFYFYTAKPEHVIIWGPFHSLEEALFYYEEQRGFTVHNMSVKVVLDEGYSSRALFRDNYHACLQNGGGIFENTSHVYHIMGNLLHHERSDSVFFKGSATPAISMAFWRRWQSRLSSRPVSV
ncbi:hypothetical protein GUITHDRAFT_144665 [Guillardia theta CCMP2712]|uniref:Uncharacterized protein n=1 Tax=Guillardia theta (strain CCMP2712) TaxID=905079 RepID=L1IPN5_GUITC|nr:hypothetical protein GUITHDRAFT_144665 [Guillardia theta CCMP2712]EKX37829.1 hypothetical protein GUITHDRAFT_144665 [Guillardia theta CCMP2712]|eukprot:XP_005824809.1 hypothetical protein GUITHDRAFT_144665 [Guillardia theta CCMP2712]